MNKSPLTKILLAVVTLLALWSLYLCYAYRSKANKFRALQFEANRDQVKLAFFEVRDEYSNSKFGRRYIDLDETEQNEMKEAVPIIISIAEPEKVVK